LGADCPWLHSICTVCQNRNAVDLRGFERHRTASLSSLIGEIVCTQCGRVGEVRLFRLTPTRPIDAG
jgi:hypothetical protein